MQLSRYLLFFFFCASTSYAQVKCKIDTSLSLKTSYETVQAHALVTSNRRMEALNIVPLKLHIEKIINKESISINDFYSTLVEVNKKFLATNVRFVVCDEIDYFTEDPLTMDDNSVTSLDIYFVAETGDACGLATVGPIGNGAVTINNNCVTVNTISHELGHYFNLNHTFETRDGIELVNSSNCKTAGDLICDTPADPKDIKIDQSCNYAGNMVDPNGQLYKPDTKNFMSYFGHCTERFTVEQQNRMRQYLDSYFLSTVSVCPSKVDLIAFPKDERVFVVGTTGTMKVYIRNVSEVDMPSSTFSVKVQTRDASGKITVLNEIPITKAIKANSLDSVVYSVPVGSSHLQGLQDLEIIFDSKNQLSESSENNNVFTRIINIVSSTTAFADLELKMISTNNAAYAGQGFTFSYSVQNIGAVETGNFMIEYILSKDSVFSDDDVVVSAFGTSNYVVGYKKDRLDNGVLLPSTVGAKYYVIILLNRYNYFPELSYANNIKIIPITIYPARPAKLPDLLAVKTEFAFNQTNPVNVGKNYTLSTFYQNIGDTLLQNKTVSLYLSKDQVKDNSDIFLTRKYSGLWLEIGWERNDYVGFTLPSSVPSGNYYVIAIADEDQMIKEKNENNNTMAFPITVAGGNLGKYRLSNPVLTSAVFERGKPWSVSVDVKNIGNAAVVEKAYTFYHLQSEKYRFFESFRYTFTSFVTDYNGPALGPQESVKYTYQGTVPASVPDGKYYFGMCMGYDVGPGISADTSIFFDIPITVTSFPLGMEESEEGLNSNLVYPNPATDVVSFHFISDRVQVFTLEGQLVLEHKNVNSFSVKDLESGIYMIRTQSAQKVSLQKLVKID
ncbi:MAG: T9SS type A sorting domain-containing protein [Opitutaceae bacterium]|nr:T9SS type A sorting domain-containing protein [Cytophagales bacterium]